MTTDLNPFAADSKGFFLLFYITFILILVLGFLFCLDGLSIYSRLFHRIPQDGMSLPHTYRRVNKSKLNILDVEENPWQA